MKLIIKTFLILTITVLSSFILSAPEYEIPTILRSNQPFNQPNNARLDYMNESSASNYKRYLDRKLKTHLQSELVREFNVEAFGKWVDFYTDENINAKPVHTILNNISDILGKSLDLQSYVNFRSGLIVKQLALFDMKLKQINVIDKAINNIKMHEGNIYTNLGNNDQWKEAMDQVTLYASSSDTDYSTKFSSLCEILGLQEESTKQPISSKKVKRPSYSKMYNERGIIISKNDGGKSDNVRDVVPPARNTEKLQKALASLDENKEIKSTKKKGREEEQEEVADKTPVVTTTPAVNNEATKTHNHREEDATQIAADNAANEENSKLAAADSKATQPPGFLETNSKKTTKTQHQRKKDAAQIAADNAANEENSKLAAADSKATQPPGFLETNSKKTTKTQHQRKKDAAQIAADIAANEENSKLAAADSKATQPPGFLETNSKKITKKRKHKHNH
jgi:hypothetical protein